MLFLRVFSITIRRGFSKIVKNSVGLRDYEIVPITGELSMVDQFLRSTLMHNHPLIRAMGITPPNKENEQLFLGDITNSHILAAKRRGEYDYIAVCLSKHKSNDVEESLQPACHILDNRVAELMYLFMFLEKSFDLFDYYQVNHVWQIKNIAVKSNMDNLQLERDMIRASLAEAHCRGIPVAWIIAHSKGLEKIARRMSFKKHLALRYDRIVNSKGEPLFKRNVNDIDISEIAIYARTV